MAIIVAGKLMLKPGSRTEFIGKSRAAMTQARMLDACEDFSVSPDPIDKNRVNIFGKCSARAPSRMHPIGQNPRSTLFLPEFIRGVTGLGFKGAGEWAD